MAFWVVRVLEIREVLRLSLRAEGLRSILRLGSVDRETARRYVSAAQECGLARTPFLVGHSDHRDVAQVRVDAAIVCSGPSGIPSCAGTTLSRW